MQESNQIHKTEIKKDKPSKNINVNEFVDDFLSDNNKEQNKIPEEFVSTYELIIIPKILVPCVEIMSRFTHRTVDEFLTELIVIGLADFYQEPEMIVYAMKDYNLLFKRLKQAFDKDVVKQEQVKNKPKSKKPSKDVEEVKFTLVIPEDLMHCIKVFCVCTNREREDLFRNRIMNHLYWIYQNYETLPGYMKDFDKFQERLRKGLNQYYGKKEF